MLFLIWTHSIPKLLTFFVPPHIVELNEDGDQNVPSDKSQKDLVSLSVVGFIIRSVDLKKKIC